MKRQPIGIDDFKHIIDNNLYFVDKTLFIKEIIDDSSLVTLIARPRRFGKTLNMSLLRYYFEASDEDTGYMFKDYKIWQQDELYISQQGKYPVIILTFKDVKTSKWEVNYDLIKKCISSEYIRHSYLLQAQGLYGADRYSFERIYNGIGDMSDYIKSLELLSKVLYFHHKVKPIILLDEYDTFLNEAYINGHWKEAVEFMKAFMNSAFKNNLYLHKGVLTGIFKVAKESIFSDMNNLNVNTILSDNYRDAFGFTQEEVEDILTYYNISEKIDIVAQWYNGYLFGETKQTTIYNPWSIIMYVNKGTLKPYWINTSGNLIIRQLAIEGDPKIQLSIQELIEGGTVNNVKIDDNVIYSEMTRSENSVWSFMLMSGYLKPSRTELMEDGIYCDLKAPNKEVYLFFRNMISNWFDETISGGSVNQMLGALLVGDIDTFSEIFTKTVLNTVSYFDVSKNNSESFYHAFVLGMLVYLDKEYEIKSNRESGYGRYDVMIIPKDKGKKGVAIEFKKASELKGESIEEALNSALAQIRIKGYEDELLQRGISDVVKVGIAFKGKNVRIGCI